jgi:hypothetical protein
MRKLFQLLAFGALFCASQQSRGEVIEQLPFPAEVRYQSSDLDHVAVFSKERTRFGPPDLTTDPDWPASPAKYIRINGNVWCMSVGKQGYAHEYAVRRPIKLHDSYKCLRTTFHVVRCFDECSAAIIEIGFPLSGNRPGTYKGSMYVDDCRGVIILGVVSDLSKGIPLNAEWLRGEVGILAHPDYPRCL